MSFLVLKTDDLSLLSPMNDAITEKKNDSFGHRKRLKDRLLADPALLADYEVLELLLGYVLLRKDTKPLAKDLLRNFQTLRGVIDAPLPELAQFSGFGEALKTFWLLLRECKARYVISPGRQRKKILSFEKARVMAQERLRGLPHEELWAAFVDTQNRLVAWKRIAKGSLDQIHIQPRDILSFAYDLKASGFFLVHNHPGGLARPSDEDISFTHTTLQAAVIMNIRFIDHLIVADETVTSMKKDGFWIS